MSGLGTGMAMEQDEANGTKLGMVDSSAMEQGDEGTGTPNDNPFQLEISNLPQKDFFLGDLKEYLAGTFKVTAAKLTSKDILKTVVEFKDKESMDIVLNLINQIVWKEKRLHAELLPSLESKKRKREEGEDAKIELTVEEELLALHLPFLKIPYKDQTTLTYKDAVILSDYLHVQLCKKNSELTGWAEQSREENGGNLLKIDPPITFQDEQVGYLTKAILYVGQNTEGEAVVGLNLPEEEGRPACTISVEPGDRLIHLPYSLKLAAKKFQEFIREVAAPTLGEQLKVANWQMLRLVRNRDGNTMMIVGLYAKGIEDNVVEEAKKKLKEYFMVGPGSECNITSLYAHIARKKKLAKYKRMIYHLDDDRILLGGQEFIEEVIGGLKYQISPFTPLRFNPTIMEGVLDGIVELANPPADSVAVILCGWPSGIPFALVNKCEYTYSLETQTFLVEDMEKTKVLNNIDNMDIIHGNFEEELAKVFEKIASKSIILILGLPNASVLDDNVAALIRKQQNILRIVGVCAEHWCGVKCWTDVLSAPNGTEDEGHPFVPVRAKPIDTAPFTQDNTILVLSERIDPSKYPPATKPIPQSFIYPLSKKLKKKKKPKPPPFAGPYLKRRKAPVTSPERLMRPFGPMLGRPGRLMRPFGPPRGRPGPVIGRPTPPFGRPQPFGAPIGCDPYVEEEERLRQHYERRIAGLERLRIIKESYAMRVAELEEETLMVNNTREGTLPWHGEAPVMGRSSSRGVLRGATRGSYREEQRLRMNIEGPFASASKRGRSDFSGDFRYGFGGYRGGYGDDQDEMGWGSFGEASAFGGGRNGQDSRFSDRGNRGGRGRTGMGRGMGRRGGW